jgi:tetratricopeptide (TPR) repeat protein
MNRRQRRANSKLNLMIDVRPAELLQAGFRHQRAGRLTEAEACYRQILAAHREHSDSIHLLGLIAHQRGRSDEAVELIRQAIRHNGLNAVYFLDLGIVLFQQRKIDEAVFAWRQAIAIKPDLAMAYCNLGVALKDQGKLDEAVAACRQAIAIKPDIAVAHHNLGVALYNQRKLDEAIAAYRRAIVIKPDLVEAHSNLGFALFDRGKLDEGVAACRRAITLNPNFTDPYNNLGLALVQLGNLSEARMILEQAVRLAPRNVKYRCVLGNITHSVAPDPNLAVLEKMAEDSASLPVDDQICLHFAVAKAYDDQGRRAEAFRHWQQGNAIKRREVVYDEAATLGEMDRVPAAITPELIQTRQNNGNPSSVPVFILGMMRSGSTLIEQILASHPQVFGGGELKHFPTAVKRLETTLGGSATYPEFVAGMTRDDYRDLGARYLAETERLDPGATHITDKMPMNFIFAGLIHLALPNAPIIHTVRDPVDTCLSCFSKLFDEPQNHTYDLAELGRYYWHYQALMAYWHRILPPGRILDVRYEDVVADLEGQARRIIAHCGLDWDPRCLAFHKTERPVRTASAVQVRQPIYDSAAGRWGAYESFLGPLLAELDIAVRSN